MIRVFLGLVVVAGALTLGGCASDGNDLEATRSSTPRGTEEPDASLDNTSFDNVLVDLDVERAHESDLSEEERDTQRRRIEAAQDEVAADLDSHGRLLRRLTATAQMSVAVDGEGREILDAHELVARVHEDDPVPPT